MSTTGTQAPMANFDTTTTMSTTSGGDGADGVDRRVTLPARLPVPLVVLDHAELADSVKPQNTPTA